MTVVTESRDVPYGRQRMFDLVADIESYPHFLPEFAAARIERQDGNLLRVRQTLRILGRRPEITTRARLSPPDSIEITGLEGPFRKLGISWAFLPLADDKCRIRYRMEYETSSVLLALLAGRIAPVMARRTVAAFERRARAVYGLAEAH